MVSDTPVLVWIRRDFRLGDHAALHAAAQTGRPVIPVFIWDEVKQTLGAAPAWRMGLAAERFGQSLERIGSRLILRRGRASDELRALVGETGADTVFWQRAYTPDQIARDKAAKSMLAGAGLTARSFAGHLLFQPWTVETGTGGYYKVFTPYWKAVRSGDPGACLPRVTRLRPPDTWPATDSLANWALDRRMNRGAGIVGRHVATGEQAATDRLAVFLGERIDTYPEARDFPGIEGTSRLSENLTHGEISPRAIWHAAKAALYRGSPGAETFLKELVWREFAYHLAWHTPHILTRNWRSDWDRFPWLQEGPQIARWQRGRTGVRFVDAAMREMYVTGTMHNRGRMIVASFLTKHLMTDWRVGQRWFADCLVDWDPAANAMGWQWAAGSGPDAAPFFRVFNPATQLEKFDKSGIYQARFIAEISRDPPRSARDFFDAVPRAWGLSAAAGYPEPMIPLADGRARALAAYAARKSG